MACEPTPSLSGWDGEPIPTPDWMTADDWHARCAASTDDEPPGEFEDEFWDPAEPWDPGEIAAIIAEADRIACDEAAAAGRIATIGMTADMAAVAASRRGPGQAGSARMFPGVCDSPAGGFGTGQGLDVTPGGGWLLTAIQNAAGDGGRFERATDDELAGLLAAADRCEASASAVKHTLAAAIARRRPGQVAGTWSEFTAQELAAVLAESRHAMETLLEVADELDAKLPGTAALFRAGLITGYKATIIATACGPLNPAEAGRAEALVLGRAPGLTPAGLRAAIARAVAEVNPGKAKKRREEGRKQARVQVWPEPSGNAGIEARELPVTDALAIDERLAWWARQLKDAGLEGGTDQLRAVAFCDLLLGRDSRPGHAGEKIPGTGFTAATTLTIPAATILGLADRPGELGGFGPVDPWLARDLAEAAAQNPTSSWCVTVTDNDGHAVGHGPNPRASGRGDPRRAGENPARTRPPAPGSASPPTSERAPAGTAPGGSALRAAARTCSSTWSR